MTTSLADPLAGRGITGPIIEVECDFRRSAARITGRVIDVEVGFRR